MNQITQTLKMMALGNQVGDYIYAFLLFILLIILFKVFKNYLLAKLETIVHKTETEIDNMFVQVIQGVRWPLYFSLSLYFSTRALQLSPTIEKGIFYTLGLLITFEGVRAIHNIIEFGTKKAVAKNKTSRHTLETLGTVAKAVLWTIAGVLILSNLGYNVSSLIAGLGIGGIAIALALQNILTDIFTSFSIYLDKPFQVGDYIVMDVDTKGTVKKIGLKTTRIESIQGEEIVISNKDLTDSRIHNFKKMKKRRIVFMIGVTYETQQSKLKSIPKIIKDIFAKTKLVDIDRVHFKEFGEYGLNFEVTYSVRSNEYKAYMDIQQRINLAIKSEFDTKGIQFAYPTQTVLVKTTKV